MVDGEKKKRGRNYGHLKGIETVKRTVRFAIKYRIPVLTFYVFSLKIGKDQKRKLVIYLN